MSLKTYDPKKVILTVGGVPIGGYADGTFINVERTNDMFTPVEGADGEVSRAKSNSKMSQLTVTLLQTSNSNSVLSGLAILDEKFNRGVVPVAIKEIGGATLITGGTGWVRKQATKEYAKEISNTEWILDIAETETLIGGNPGTFPVLG